MFDVQWYASVWSGLLIQLNETVMALVFVMFSRASSRASLAPTGLVVSL